MKRLVAQEIIRNLGGCPFYPTPISGPSQEKALGLNKLCQVKTPIFL